MAYTHLDPGHELEISTRVYFHSHQTDISELVKLTPEQLNEQESASIEQEKAIYEKMLEMEMAWGRQAGCTMALQKAREYLRTPLTKHTSNQWVAGEYGWHELSNMVYKFTWHIYENSGWSQAEKKSVIYSYDLSWYLTYNTPQKPDYTGPGRQIAGRSASFAGPRPAWTSTCKAVSKPIPICSQNLATYSRGSEKSLFRQRRTPPRLYGGGSGTNAPGGGRRPVEPFGR